ncbi:MAG: hypothetical protein QOJ11_4050 [Frankiales bacterium]|jgi:hypothetical protein|nr:hypothetical protein [Frankiales bacterium]
MNDRIDDFFEREREAVPLLAPPPGRFEELQTVARRRRNRNTTVVSAAAAVVLAVAGTGAVLGAQSLGHSNNLSGPAGLSSTATLGGYSATASPSADLGVPKGFKAWSMSFIHDTAWALGTYSCGSNQCAAVVRTRSYPHPFQTIMQPDASQTRALGLSSGTPTIRFANTSDGWIVDAQQVLSTHDGGYTWSQVKDLAGAHVTALEHWGSTTYAMGPDGSSLWISRDNASDRWVAQAGLGLPNFDATSTDTLIPDSLAVAAVRSTGFGTAVSLSRDLGVTWSPVTLPCKETSSGPAPLFSLLDADYARVVCGNGDVYKIVTADNSWKQQGHVGLPADATGVVGRSIASNGVTTVAAYTGAGLWATSDKGVTWNRAAVGDFSYVGLTDERQGVALPAAPSDTFLITYDGGKTWQQNGFQ